jgi:hydroxymethylglutaryl-CoA reductase
MIEGFSKYSLGEKITALKQNITACEETWKTLSHSNYNPEKVYSKLSENTLSQFVTPYGVAPNFLINDKVYHVPIVTEESSVVAAASRAAKYWNHRGGFKAVVKGEIKEAHYYFYNEFASAGIQEFFEEHKSFLIESINISDGNMKARGGGIIGLDLIHDKFPYYAIRLTALTCDAMGANYLNTHIESVGKIWNQILPESLRKNYCAVMGILSNYTPQSLVEVSCTCPLEDFVPQGLEISSDQFLKQMDHAYTIAHLFRERAVTHNKGILNGIDAVAMATGNDFRAIEACAHAYASKSGNYRSLSWLKYDQKSVSLFLEIPLAVGTVGGITHVHPLAKTSLDLLGNPQAKELMMILASVGLAQNFAAVSSLVTTGIQKGHMKMHLYNLACQNKATEDELNYLTHYFSDKVVSAHSVKIKLEEIRNNAI